MTCANCAIHKGGFASEAAYEAFESTLQAAVSKGEFVFLGKDPSGGAFLKQLYQCAKCGERWEFVAPDQAFRGAWKQLEGD